jgi:hypothetical protein
MQRWSLPEWSGLRDILFHALLVNIRLEWKTLTVTNTLAYYGTKLKCFMTQASLCTFAWPGSYAVAICSLSSISPLLLGYNKLYHFFSSQAFSVKPNIWGQSNVLRVEKHRYLSKKILDKAWKSFSMSNTLAYCRLQEVLCQWPIGLSKDKRKTNFCFVWKLSRT